MPSFSKYVDVEVDIDLSIDDILWELDSREKEELVERLIEDGYALEIIPNSESIYEWEFNKIIKKITDNRVMLTAEEDALLKKISDRF
jgi:hypothetical protein